MSDADKRDFVKKNAQWATASLVYAVGTIALVWACLLPGLMLVALCTVLVGSNTSQRS